MRRVICALSEHPSHFARIIIAPGRNPARQDNYQKWQERTVAIIADILIELSTAREKCHAYPHNEVSRVQTARMKKSGREIRRFIRVNISIRVGQYPLHYCYTLH